MSMPRPLFLAFIIWVVAAGTAAADDPSKEFWPEIDTWVRLSPAWRFSLFVPISENLDTHYREGNLLLQGDYAWGTSDRQADSGRDRRLVSARRDRRERDVPVRLPFVGDACPRAERDSARVLRYEPLFATGPHARHRQKLVTMAASNRTRITGIGRRCHRARSNAAGIGLKFSRVEGR
jgi:hypothetical protein